MSRTRSRPARRLLAAGLLAALLLGSALPARAQPADLAAALIAQADLPAGWDADPATVAEVTADIRDDGYCDAGPITFRPAALAVAAFDQRPGPQPSRGDFLDSDSPTILHVVAGFAPGEAEPAFACLRGEIAGDFRPSDEAAAAVPLPSYGDERYSVRIEERTPEAVARLDIVMIRRGTLISVLIVVDISPGARRVPADLTLALAAIADLRLANALKK